MTSLCGMEETVLIFMAKSHGFIVLFHIPFSLSFSCSSFFFASLRSDVTWFVPSIPTTSSICLESRVAATIAAVIARAIVAVVTSSPSTSTSTAIAVTISLSLKFSLPIRPQFSFPLFALHWRRELWLRAHSKLGILSSCKEAFDRTSLILSLLYRTGCNGT